MQILIVKTIKDFIKHTAYRIMGEYFWREECVIFRETSIVENKKEFAAATKSL